jgi:hypothetical protein
MYSERPSEHTVHRQLTILRTRSLVVTRNMLLSVVHQQVEDPYLIISQRMEAKTIIGTLLERYLKVHSGLLYGLWKRWNGNTLGS